MRDQIFAPTAAYRRLFAITVIFAFALTAGFRHLDAQEQKPNARDRQISIAIANLMRTRHLASKGADDKISQRGLEQYLKALDPAKVYFLQTDVNEFNKQRNDLDEMLADGDLSLAFKIFKTFLARVDDRVKKANQLIDTKFDFTKDEEIVTDPEMLKFAKDKDELDERWRKRIKFNVLVMKTANAKKIKEGKKPDNISERLRKRYKYFAKRMRQFDNEEISEMYLTAITSSFDPHSTYFSRRTLENFTIIMTLSLEGIGASLASEDGETVVKRIVPGGAAAKHGKLKVEDKIIGVAQGKDGETVDVREMKLDNVVEKIRGKAGTVVKLDVLKSGSTEVESYSITREKIELKDSAAHGEIFEGGSKPNGKPYKLGVVVLPSFYSDMGAARRGEEGYRSSTQDTKRILEEFKSKDVDAVVLDLRTNGGGSLGEAIDCSGLFIDRGPVVLVKDSLGRVRTHRDTERGMAWSGPLVVLTSKFSASASEILAGAIKDYKRGIVVGDASTHGKGTVQSLINVAQYLTGLPRESSNMGALKVTMQQFYRPNGASTQKKGVLSDIVLPSLTNHMDVGEADMDYAVDFDQIEKVEFDQFAMTNPDIFKSLTENSKSRMAKSEKFKEIRKEIEEYKIRKAKKTATLNEEKFVAEQKKLNAKNKNMDDMTDEDENKIKRDYYLNEVLAIAVDYVQLLKKKKIN